LFSYICPNELIPKIHSDKTTTYLAACAKRRKIDYLMGFIQPNADVIVKEQKKVINSVTTKDFTLSSTKYPPNITSSYCKTMFYKKRNKNCIPKKK
jgi:hypothetical protein